MEICAYIIGINALTSFSSSYLGQFVLYTINSIVIFFIVRYLYKNKKKRLKKQNENLSPHSLLYKNFKPKDLYQLLKIFPSEENNTFQYMDYGATHCIKSGLNMYAKSSYNERFVFIESEKNILNKLQSWNQCYLELPKSFVKCTFVFVIEVFDSLSWQEANLLNGKILLKKGDSTKSIEPSNMQLSIASTDKIFESKYDSCIQFKIYGKNMTILSTTKNNQNIIRFSIKIKSFTI